MSKETPEDYLKELREQAKGNNDLLMKIDCIEAQVEFAYTVASIVSKKDFHLLEAAKLLFEGKLSMIKHRYLAIDFPSGGISE